MELHNGTNVKEMICRTERARWFFNRI